VVAGGDRLAHFVEQGIARCVLAVLDPDQGESLRFTTPENSRTVVA
jgi:hypothetical protein